MKNYRRICLFNRTLPTAGQMCLQKPREKLSDINYWPCLTFCSVNTNSLLIKSEILDALTKQLF